MADPTRKTKVLSYIVLSLRYEYEDDLTYSYYPHPLTYKGHSGSPSSPSPPERETKWPTGEPTPSTPGTLVGPPWRETAPTYPSCFVKSSGTFVSTELTTGWNLFTGVLFHVPPHRFPPRGPERCGVFCGWSNSFYARKKRRVSPDNVDPVGLCPSGKKGRKIRVQNIKVSWRYSCINRGKTGNRVTKKCQDRQTPNNGCDVVRPFNRQVSVSRPSTVSGRNLRPNKDDFGRLWSIVGVSRWG